MVARGQALVPALLAALALLATACRAGPVPSGEATSGDATRGAAQSQTELGAADAEQDGGDGAGSAAGASVSPAAAGPLSAEDAAALLDALPAPAAEPAPDAAEVLAALREEPPAQDPARLAQELGRVENAEAVRVRAEPPPERAVGDRETFRVQDITGQRVLQVDAVLEVATENAWFWVQDGLQHDAAALEEAAHAFSDEIMPALRADFGSEWSPGVDGDPRVHVLHHEPILGIAGYYSSADEVTRAVDPDSNEREMFYVNHAVYAPGGESYLGLLAHEFQHMIHWSHDPGEPAWVNEGLSELAPHRVGYGSQNGFAFTSVPDTGLTRWEPTSDSNALHYAASFLFFDWLEQQLGDEVLGAVVAAEGNGARGIEEALAALGEAASFDELFLDWSVANRMGGEARAEGNPRWRYPERAPRPVTAEPLDERGRRTTVGQHATDAWDLSGLVDEAGTLELSFRGDAGVPLFPPAPSDPDRPVWWSNRGDNAEARLERTLDLREHAPGEDLRLVWRQWREIEEGWDYGYLLAAGEDGVFHPLATSASRAEDPNGANLGQGITGESEGWEVASADLSAFAGQELRLRFALVNDDAVALTGWAVADPALVTEGRAERLPTEGWDRSGWLRVPATLPQRWGLQLLVDDGERLRVERPETDAEGRATLSLTDLPPEASVTLLVSGLTPATRNPAAYEIVAAAPAR